MRNELMKKQFFSWEWVKLNWPSGVKGLNEVTKYQIDKGDTYRILAIIRRS